MLGAVSCTPVGPTIVGSYPDVENYCRIFSLAGEPVIRFEDKAFVEKRLIYADSTFFEVFDGFSLKKGDIHSILKKKNTMVLTESTAKRYFGNEDPVGKVVQFGQQRQNWEIVGVAVDPPSNSHIKFDIVCSFNTLPLSQNTFWIGNNVYTYILAKAGADPHDLNKKLAELTLAHAGPQFEQVIQVKMEDFGNSGNRYGYFVQPLLDIHLKSNLQYDLEPGGNIVMVYVFMLIAIFIIVIAAINFMNLATARSAKRAREVGMRKVFGSSKLRLIVQFLTESIILTSFSLLVAILLVYLALPEFNGIAGKSLDLSTLPLALTAGSLVAIVMLVGVAAGSYPAFFLASFQPIKVLKGKLATGAKNSYLRGILVIIQFTITIGLIASTLIVNKQISYIRSKDLGFKYDNLVFINRGYAIPQERRETFLNELRKIPNVESVTGSSGLPGTITPNTAIIPQGAASTETNVIDFIACDEEFIKTLGIELLQGRDFNKDLASDSLAMIINEAAITALGLRDSALDRVLMLNLSQPYKVVGVARNFHYKSLHMTINPMALVYQPANTYITLKLGNGNRQNTIRAIESKWAEFLPDQAFSYTFMDQHLDSLYGSEKRARVLFTLFSILAIIIASLGLLGLASYSAEQRTREIGIRKVIGATIQKIVRLLIKEVNVLFLISTVVAWPIAWYLMSGWLNNFAYRIRLSPVEFVLASVIAYAIAIFTVSYQAFRAARSNPANTLKYE
jgi:putative ABC transport system permease protein